MNFVELLKTGGNVSVSIGIEDLKQWHKEVIADTRRELEEIILSDKAETYPTPKQVAEMLNVNVCTLWRWHKKKYLVPIEVGGKRRYRMSQIKAILNSGNGGRKK